MVRSIRILAAVALGSAASAVLGAFGSVQPLGSTHYLREWQLWWAGNWLGSLCVAPVIMAWAVRFRKPEFAVAPPPAVEPAPPALEPPPPADPPASELDEELDALPRQPPSRRARKRGPHWS